MTPPSNDLFENASVVDLAFPRRGRSDYYSNYAATKEPGEPDHAGNPGGHSLWWSWKPWASRPANVLVSFMHPPALIGVYTGDSLATLSPSVSGTNFVTFPASSNQTYRIAIDGMDGMMGSFRLGLGLDFFSLSPASADSGDIPGVRLSIESASPTEPGQHRFVHLLVRGATGRRVRLQTSLALVHWSDLASVTVTESTWEYTDPPPESSTNQFYGASLEP